MFNLTSWLITVVVLLYTHFCIKTSASLLTKDAELRLRKDILEKHSSKISPSLNKTAPVTVFLDIGIRQFLEVDEKKQVVVTLMSFRQYWKDHFLTWNASQYAGVNKLHVDKSEIWVPDITVFNTASDLGMLYNRLDSQVVIYSDGNATWFTPIQLKTECKIDIKYFPFDEQICRIKFGSWTYHGYDVDIHQKEKDVDTGSYLPHTEWDLIETYFSREVKIHRCCKEPYPTLTVHFRLQRRALFYFINLVFPCGVIALLASLSFLLPSNNGERISLVVAVLLSLTVYMLIASEKIPASSEVVPLIGKFYMSTMILIALTLIAVCVTLNCYERETRMSSLLHRVFMKYLSRIARVDGTSREFNGAVVSVNEGFLFTNDVIGKDSNETKPDPDISVMTSDKTDQKPIEDRVNISSEKQDKTSLADLRPQVSKVPSDKKIIKAEWKTASRILDRIFCFIFLFSFFLVSVIVFSEAPSKSLS